MTAFRERNPVIDRCGRSGGDRVVHARRLPRRGPAADRRRRHLLRPVQRGRRAEAQRRGPGRRRPRRQGRGRHARRRPRAGKFRIDEGAEFGDETGASIRVKTLLGAMFLALEPAGAGQLDQDSRSRSRGPASPYDVVEAFAGSPDTEQIDTDQLAQSLNDARRHVPQHARRGPGSLRGLSRLRRTSRPATSSSTPCSPTPTRSRRCSPTATGTSSADARTATSCSGRWSRGGRRCTTCWSPPSSCRTSSPGWSRTPAPTSSRRSTTWTTSSTCSTARGQPRQQPAADGAVLPGLRQHPRHRTVVRHLHPEPAARPGAPDRWVADMAGSCSKRSRSQGAVGLLLLAVVAAAGHDVAPATGDQDADRVLPAHGLALRGPDVRILGVPVGRSSRSTPAGTEVKVTMTTTPVRRPRRRQSRHHLAGDRRATASCSSRRPTPAARCWTTTPSSSRTGPRTRRAGRDLPEPRRPERRARAERGEQGRRARQPGRRHRRQLRRPGRAAPPDHQGPRQVHRRLSTTTRKSCSPPSPSSNRFVGMLAANDQTIRSFNKSLAEVPTCWRASARTSRRARQPGHGVAAGVDGSWRRTKGRSGATSRAQPGVEGAGQAA